jgi:large repetitive protein
MLEETAYEYDAVGNRTAVIVNKGQRIEYTYNEINRMTQVRYYNDGTTSASYLYDDLARKTSETVNYGLFSLTYTYEYYANSIKKSFTGPDGNTITYSYDENNRTEGITIPGQGQINYNYDAAHWNSPARMILPGGSQTQYT